MIEDQDPSNACMDVVRMWEDRKMTLVEHLEELRTRVIISIFAWAIAFAFVYYFVPQIIELLTVRLSCKLVFVDPSEAFFAYMKVAALGGFFLALPIILYQTVAFTAPALEPSQRRWILFPLPVALLLFFAGAIFSYLLIVPVTLKFFLGFATVKLEPMISIGKFISFVGALLLISGLVFETPLVIFFLAMAGLVSSRSLREKRRYVILSFFILAAVITPTPDAFTQTVVALPMCLLYELSILLVRLIGK